MARNIAVLVGLALLGACGGSKAQKSSEPAKESMKAPAMQPKPMPAPAAKAAPAASGEKVFVEKEGLIVIEAENFDANTPKEAHKWVKVTEPAGASGGAGMDAQPNDEVNNNEDFLTLSPRMDYKVKFEKAGTFRVWVRGWGRGESDNSCHVGLNGQAVETSDRIGEFPAEEWAWLNDTHDGEPAALEVKTAGVHTLNVWMREDGFVIDKILLARDASYAPQGAGPAETRP